MTRDEAFAVAQIRANASARPWYVVGFEHRSWVAPSLEGVHPAILAEGRIIAIFPHGLPEPILSNPGRQKGRRR